MAVLPSSKFAPSRGNIAHDHSKQLSQIERAVRTVALYGLLFFLAFLFLLPFYLLIRNALLTEKQFSGSEGWIWFPLPPQFQSWYDVFHDDAASMIDGLKNSGIIAITQVVGQMLFASLAGYGLARVPFRWNKMFFYLILFTLMIPSAVTFIPTFLVVANLGWVNTLQGLIVPGLFSSFSALLFRQYFLDFPRELEEAAQVDGLGYWGIFWRILVPNSQAVFLSLGLLSFMTSWNSFLWPLVIGQDSSMWTIQVVISTFITQQAVNFPAIFMGAIISIVPLLIIFFFFQRYIVAGLARTGIKD
ncbi:sugar ABC transporter permease [Dictyobacter alpinus]|uniref:Sugar ABC transporter permease n=1 Tax=Dictyobacter alpinus TaxID=2014873 RepID=A0A402BE48_9CHLR|nr:carbohydrate ABC transporter permease [Dictyobacter alpinus]GCE29576.1 sugar ABC transporter permease [Dictyobacter alpinus]